MKQKGIEQLKRVLINDKKFHPYIIGELLKSEVFNCLKNYMEISPENIYTNIQLNEDGQFIFKCEASSYRLKSVGILPGEYDE